MGGKADSEVKVKFVTEHDGSGADAANRKLDETKGKTAAASGGFAGLGRAVTGFKESLTKAIAVGASMASIVQSIMTVVKAFADARKAHEDMVAAIQADNAAAGVGRLKAAYDEMKESVALVSDEITAARENMDGMLDSERRLQDAALTRREEDEVAALGKDDPLAKEKEAEIRARYGQARAETAGKRGVEDVAAQEARLREDIARREGLVREREQAAADAEAAARDYSGSAAGNNEKAAAESQKTDVWGRKGHWGLGWANKKAEQYAGYASEYNKQASGALGLSIQARKDADAERAAIKAAQDRLPVLARQREAAAAEGSVDTFKASRAASGAHEDLSRAAAERERDARDLERARRDKAQAEERKRGLEGGMPAAAGRAETESQEAWRARNALEMHGQNRPANGGGRKWADTQRALQAAWEKEQSEADAAARAAETLGEATAKSMQTLNAKLSAAAAKIKTFEAKLNQDARGDNGNGG